MENARRQGQTGFCSFWGAEQKAILLKSKDFLKASYLAETLSMSEPENVDRMLDVARYRYQAGEFKDALDWLVSVEKKCLSDPDFHYLSAQCHAAFGDLEQARGSLQKVAIMSESLRMKALDDPAFEAIYGAEPISDKIQ